MYAEKKEGNVSWLHENIKNTLMINSQISLRTPFLLHSIPHQVSITDYYDYMLKTNKQTNFKFPGTFALYP